MRFCAPKIQFPKHFQCLWRRSRFAESVATWLVLCVLFLSAPKFTLGADCNPREFSVFVRALTCKECDRGIQTTLEDMMENGSRMKDVSVWVFDLTERIDPKVYSRIFKFADNPDIPYVIVDRLKGTVRVPGKDGELSIEYFLKRLQQEIRAAGYARANDLPLDIRSISGINFLSELNRNGAITRHRSKEDSVLALMIETPLIQSIGGKLSELYAGARAWRSARTNNPRAARKLAEKIMAGESFQLNQFYNRSDLRFERLASEVTTESKQAPEVFTPDLDESGPDADGFINIFALQSDEAKEAGEDPLLAMQREMDGGRPSPDRNNVGNSATIDDPTANDLFAKEVSLRSLYGTISPEDAVRIDNELRDIMMRSNPPFKYLLRQMRGKTLQEAVNVGVELNRLARERIQTILTSIPDTPANSHIRDVVEQTLKQLNKSYSFKKWLSQLNANAHRFIGKPPNPDEVMQVLRGAFLPTPAYIAELRFALRTPGLQGTSTYINDLPQIRALTDGVEDKGIVDQILGKVFSSQNQFRVDIDVIFNYGKAWGEFKNYSGVVELHQPRWKRIEKQAIRMIAAQRAMKAADPPLLPADHEVHYFFAEGISPEAKERLLRLGVNAVHP